MERKYINSETEKIIADRLVYIAQEYNRFKQFEIIDGDYFSCGDVKFQISFETKPSESTNLMWYLDTIVVNNSINDIKWRMNVYKYERDHKDFNILDYIKLDYIYGSFIDFIEKSVFSNNVDVEQKQEGEYKVYPKPLEQRTGRVERPGIGAMVYDMTGDQEANNFMMSIEKYWKTVAHRPLTPEVVELIRIAGKKFEEHNKSKMLTTLNVDFAELYKPYIKNGVFHIPDSFTKKFGPDASDLFTKTIQAQIIKPRSSDPFRVVSQEFIDNIKKDNPDIFEETYQKIKLEMSDEDKQRFPHFAEHDTFADMLLGKRKAFKEKSDEEHRKSMSDTIESINFSGKNIKFGDSDPTHKLIVGDNPNSNGKGYMQIAAGTGKGLEFKFFERCIVTDKHVEEPVDYLCSDKNMLRTIILSIMSSAVYKNPFNCYQTAKPHRMDFDEESEYIERLGKWLEWERENTPILYFELREDDLNTKITNVCFTSTDFINSDGFRITYDSSRPGVNDITRCWINVNMLYSYPTKVRMDKYDFFDKNIIKIIKNIKKLRENGQETSTGNPTE